MRQFVAVGAILTAIFVSSCSSEHPGKVVPGYSGGCEKGFDILTQNQFAAGDGGYGALVYIHPPVNGNDPVHGQHAGLNGNNKLHATGWLDTGVLIYPNNPAGIQGKVWYYIPKLAGWVSDAGVRAVQTTPAPGNLDGGYDQATQAAPKPQKCKLTH